MRQLKRISLEDAVIPAWKRSFKDGLAATLGMLDGTRQGRLSGLCPLNRTPGSQVNMTVPNEILKDALTLKPEQKAELVDELLSSLDKPDKEIDELWAKEAESKNDAYEQGKIKAIDLEKVLEKYK